MIQFGMWLMRPRVVREFRGYRETVAETSEWFDAVLDAVDRVHLDPVLRQFWQTGRIVPNRSRLHPYQTSVPDEVKRVDRWFLLDTSVDPEGSWSLGTQLPVYRAGAGARTVSKSGVARLLLTRRPGCAGIFDSPYRIMVR
jgi:hypothetical protein